MMKDKLYKYNHKKPYYLFRNTFLIMGLFIGLSCAIAVPMTINLLSKEPMSTKAEENSVEEIDNNLTEQLTSYNNNSLSN